MHLDGPALVWEYLRRHRQPDAVGHWGQRLLEDPAQDARDTHPAWFPDHDAVVQLYPDAATPRDALCFEFWKLPGHKHLTHDGKRFVLASGLADGMACAVPCERYAALASELNKIAVWRSYRYCRRIRWLGGQPKCLQILLRLFLHIAARSSGTVRCLGQYLGVHPVL